MKRILLIAIFAVLPIWAEAATYYVSAAGDDGANGTTTGTPWLTINKVNTSTFSAGDSILFRRGDTWREQLTLPSSGSAGSPITFGAYGTGAKPIIEGGDAVTGWTLSASENIYYTTLPTWTFASVSEGVTPYLNVTWNTNLATTAAAMSAGSWTSVDAILASDTIPGDNTNAIRYATDRDKFAQGINLSAASVITSVGVSIKKNGTITAGKKVWVEIWNDSAGAPNAMITNGQSAKLEANDISGTTSLVDFSFSTFPSLSASTQYYVVLLGDYSASSSNNIGITLNGTGGYAGGFLMPYNSDTTTWTTDWWSGARDLAFEVNCNLLYAWATDSADPDTHTINVSRRSSGILGNSKNYITVQDLQIQHANQYHGILTGTTGWTCQRLNLFGNISNGISFNGAASLIISDVTAAYNWRGLGGASFTNLTISDSTSRDNTILTDGDGIFLDTGNAVIQRCQLYGNDRGTSADGIQSAAASITSVSYCYIHDNRIGLNFTDGGYGSIFGSLMVDNIVGVDVYSAAGNCRIYNNTIYQSQAGGGGIEVSTLSTGKTANIKNNISVNTLAGGALKVADVAGTVTVLNNCFGAEKTAFVNWRGTNYATYDLLETAYGGTTSSAESDPSFVTAGSNFRLQVGSPAIDTGVSLGAAYDDINDPADSTFPYTTIDQDLCGAGWEIGAFGYGSEATPTPTPTNTVATPTFTKTPTVTATPTPTTIMTGRQLWIDFEDRYTDQSGIGRTTSKTGTVTYVTGIHGKAGLFSAGSYISYYDAPGGTDNSAALSWAGWFKRPDITTEADNIIFKSSVFKLRADIGGGGEWDGYVIDNAAHQAWPGTLSDQADTTGWCHVGMTADLAGDANTILWYFAGQVVRTVNPSPFGDLLGNTSDSGSVGASGFTVDEFMIWNRAITSDEMLSLAELPAPTPTPTNTGNTPTPTVTFTPTITETPTNTVATPTPTNTVPTPTPTATATGVYKYVRDGATGSGNGSDWTNASDDLPAVLVRGTTYLVADGTYGTYTFNDANDENKIITIQKATGASHGTDTGWFSTYGDGVAQWNGYLYFTTDYYTLDGVTGGGPGAWETGHGFCFDYTGWHSCHLEGVRHDIALRHCDFESGGRTSTNTEDQIFYGIGSPYNITIQYCWMHDVRGCQMITRSGHDYLIEYNKWSRNGGGGITSHREAWSGSDESDVIFRYNFLEDISNSGMLCLVNGNGYADNWQIYGNLFTHSTNLVEGDNQISPGSILTKYADPTYITARNWKIYNNTFANINGQAGFRIMEVAEVSGATVTARNNVWYNNYGYNAIHSPSDTIDIDYSKYIDNRTGAGADLDVAAAAAEDNSTAGSGSPFTGASTGDYTLTAGVAGTALDAPYNTDMFGNTRGGDGTFDMGAIEYVGAAAPTPTPTNTATATPTITNTPVTPDTPTPTNTVTQTFTKTPTRTVTPTGTRTRTPTRTPTYKKRDRILMWDLMN